MMLQKRMLVKGYSYGISKYALYPHMTVRENIEFILKQKVVEKEKEKNL